MVEKGELEAEDVTEALISDGTTHADDVIDIIRELYNYLVRYYFPNGHLNGKNQSQRKDGFGNIWVTKRPTANRRSK
ncbi:MAG: hypothetical protein IPP61_00545 [Cytophagaceae bacterium]|nr:hypothetical protein [Cytophagaceae bacterium]